MLLKILPKWINRNIIVLVCAQALGMCTTSIMVLTGGIIGQTLSPSHSLSTLPPTLTILGGALAAAPASLFMAKYGRKKGFTAGSLVGSIAAILAWYAINGSDFTLFCIAAFMLGINMAYIQQYRFAAAENVPPANASTAISLLILSGLFAAVAGPEAAITFRQLAGHADYAGSYLALAVFNLSALFALLFFVDRERSQEIQTKPGTGYLSQLIRQPALLLAIIAGSTGFSVMSLIMTATPISMHTIDSFSMHHTKSVIQWHVLAMFLPSLFSGHLIKHFGEIKLILSGCCCLLLCVGINLLGRDFSHYSGALILLGVGWNFCFVAATTLLTKSFTDNRRYHAQAINDFCVFSSQAVGALSAGALLVFWGWETLNIIALPSIFLTLLSLGIYTKWNKRYNSTKS